VIISLDNINLMVFTVEMQCVYCEVRTEFLYSIYVNVMLYSEFQVATACFSCTPPDLNS
jgi:hypothetical protein